jgi:hypothetical protein
MLWKIVSPLFHHPFISLLVMAVLGMGIYGLVNRFAGPEGLLKAKKVCVISFLVSAVLLLCVVASYPFFASLNADGYGGFVPLALGLVLLPIVVVTAILGLVFKLAYRKNTA